ncbi:MAG: sulfite exporter TauE/SafE family protein [Bacteroidales bacterium]|nr:sulfite exporter TauE/SafE family protein [Bacteroidales bacterium]
MENGIEIFLLASGASFVQRTTGFGFGIFIMTVLPFLMPSYGEATTLSGLLALTTSITIAFRMRKLVSWKRLCPILGAFIIVSAASICFLNRIEGNLMRQILGGTLIITGLYFAFLRNRIRIGTTPAWQIGTGMLSGVMGGFFGMQGPPAVLYFISSEPDKEHYMAMTQMYFAIGNAGMTIIRSCNGYLSESVGWGYLAGIGGAAVGLLLGGYAFRHIPNRIFSYIVYAYICISGLIILLTSL